MTPDIGEDGVPLGAKESASQGAPARGSNGSWWCGARPISDRAPLLPGGAVLARSAIGLRSSLGPLATALEAPLADLGVVAREQDLRDGLPAPFGRPGVVRILRRSRERRAEWLLHGALLVAKGAGQLAYYRVADDHGRELAA